MVSSAALGPRLTRSCNAQTTSCSMWEIRIPSTTFTAYTARGNKRWLPAATGTGSTGDDQEFLLDVPPPVETITLGEMKRRIAQLSTELNGGDGSEEYRDCVLSKYRHIRNQRNWPEERGHTYTPLDSRPQRGFRSARRHRAR